MEEEKKEDDGQVYTSQVNGVLRESPDRMMPANVSNGLSTPRDILGPSNLI